MKTFKKTLCLLLVVVFVLVLFSIVKIQQAHMKKNNTCFIIELKAAHLIVSDIRSLQDSFFIQFQIHSMIVVSSTDIRVAKGSHNWIGGNSPIEMIQ